MFVKIRPFRKDSAKPILQIFYFFLVPFLILKADSIFGQSIGSGLGQLVTADDSQPRDPGFDSGESSNLPVTTYKINVV